MVPTVIQPQIDDDNSAPESISFGEQMECLEIVDGISPMPQETSRQANSQMRLGSLKPRSNMSISGLEPAAEHNMSYMLKAKPDEPVSFYPCISPPANDHIDVGFGRRHGDSFCVCGAIDRQTVIIDVISL